MLIFCTVVLDFCTAILVTGNLSSLLLSFCNDHVGALHSRAWLCTAIPMAYHLGPGLLSFCFSRAGMLHGHAQREHNQFVSPANTPVLDSTRPCLTSAQPMLECCTAVLRESTVNLFLLPARPCFDLCTACASILARLCWLSARPNQYDPPNALFIPNCGGFVLLML